MVVVVVLALGDVDEEVEAAFDLEAGGLGLHEGALQVEDLEEFVEGGVEQDVAAGLEGGEQGVEEAVLPGKEPSPDRPQEQHLYVTLPHLVHPPERLVAVNLVQQLVPVLVPPPPLFEQQNQHVRLLEVPHPRHYPELFHSYCWK